MCQISHTKSLFLHQVSGKASQFLGKLSNEPTIGLYHVQHHTRTTIKTFVPIKVGVWEGRGEEIEKKGRKWGEMTRGRNNSIVDTGTGREGGTCCCWKGDNGGKRKSRKLR